MKVTVVALSLVEDSPAFVISFHLMANKPIYADSVSAL